MDAGQIGRIADLLRPAAPRLQDRDVLYASSVQACPELVEGDGKLRVTASLS